MKIPEPIMPPITIMVASNRPSLRASCVWSMVTRVTRLKELLDKEQVRKRGLPPLVPSKPQRGQAPLPDLFYFWLSDTLVHFVERFEFCLYTLTLLSLPV